MSRDSNHVRASIEQHSKSFALASRLLPADVGRDAAVLYAYCRRADDLIDLCPEGQAQERLAQLRAELVELYANDSQYDWQDATLARFAKVVKERALPRVYLEELLLGMEMDVVGTHYRSLSDVLLYAYRVAGTVGLMMCHVMGIRAAAALRHAAHLGMAMQLTNIARDVYEDWQRGRLYLPEDTLTQFGVCPPLHAQLGQPLPPTAAAGVARATEALLRQAEAYYRSGDAGVPYLSTRCGLAIRAARLVYSEIGVRLRAQAWDPFAPRAVVSRARKWELVAQAVQLSVSDVRVRLSRQALRRAALGVPGECVVQPETLFMVV
ncbi:MAG: hypothetical protein RL701_160 [Pseudomonadota bacterium]|jgi:phytoene synthase